MYNIDPATRYKYISQKIEINKIKQLYEKYSVNALDLTDLQYGGGRGVLPLERSRTFF